MMGYATAGNDLSEGRTLQKRHTGDIAERTTSGYFRITGRKARFSKIAGFRVSHDNVEERLAENRVSALVTGTDQFLAVALTDTTSVDEATKAILQFTNLNLKQLKVFHLKEVPRLSSGKLDYKTIKDIAEKAPVRLDTKDHTNPILKSFAEAFWPRAVAQDDSFESLGGDSLTFVQLSLALEKEIGRLPSNWEAMSISKLSQKRERHDRWSMIDPNVYLRAFAISLVVLVHLSNWGFTGGVSVLMLLVGYNVARFQSNALFDGRVGFIGRTLVKNLLLYYLVLLFWFVWEKEFSVPHLLLVSNILAAPIEPIAYNVYWFVEAYAQIIFFLICVFSISAIRKRVSGKPLFFGICALAFSIGLLFAWRHTWEQPWNACAQGPCYPVSETALIAAIGWCLYFAKSSVSKFLIASGAILTLSFLSLSLYSGLSAFTLLIVSIIILSARISLPMPAPVAAVLSNIAAYSYAIYLVHLIPFTILHASGIRSWGLNAICLGVGLSYLVQIAVQRLNTSASNLGTIRFRRDRN